MSEYSSGQSRGKHVAPAPSGPERVRFGLPFNGVLPIWHEGTEITWHRPLDDTDFSEVLGLGYVRSEPGPSSAPAGWSEQVEVGTLTDAGRTLRLHAIDPVGRRAINDPGDGAAVPLSPPLSVSEAMGESFDLENFTVHVGRLLLRAAREKAIVLFTLRAPRDPEPHHVLSVPAEIDSDRFMRLHLGTLLKMTGGAWDDAVHRGGMTLLDLRLPYDDLLIGSGSESEQGLNVERLMEVAEPVVGCLLMPGFPFALGWSFILRENAPS